MTRREWEKGRGSEGARLVPLRERAIALLPFIAAGAAIGVLSTLLAVALAGWR